jgi:hypothetical protein
MPPPYFRRHAWDSEDHGSVLDWIWFQTAFSNLCPMTSFLRKLRIEGGR